ncbi:MAG: HIRAN domain-containing protein [Pseudomonadota bacterium]
MAQEKFGQDRYLPEGDWAFAVEAAAVAGTKFRKNQAHDFAKAVKVAEQKGLEYGLELEPEPDNRADPNAIKVIGFAETAGWFGRVQFQEWHVGYIDKALAKTLQKEMLGKDVEIVAELQHVTVDGEKVGIEMSVLQPEEAEPTKQ